jgi:hypothetical protein
LTSHPTFRSPFVSIARKANLLLRPEWYSLPWPRSCTRSCTSVQLSVVKCTFVITRDREKQV